MKRIWLLLLALVLTGLLARFGFWQLDRAVEKQGQLERYDARTVAQPLSATELLRSHGATTELQFRRAEVAGHYDSDHQFLLDNRTEDGIAGYHVYTPLVVDSVLPLLLVNRGWLPAGPRREQLPSLQLTAGPRLVRGTVELPRSDLFLLGDDGYTTANWPRVVQKLDPEKAGIALGQSVAPIVLVLDPAEADGYSRRWSAYLGISPDRHRGYALQWFALAATLLVITLSLFWRSLRTRARQT